MKITESELRQLIRESMKKEKLLLEKSPFRVYASQIRTCEQEGVDIALPEKFLTSDAKIAMSKIGAVQGFPFCDFVNILFGDVPRMFSKVLDPLTTSGAPGGTEVPLPPGIKINPKKFNMIHAYDTSVKQFNNPTPMFTNSTAKFFPKTTKAAERAGVDRLNEVLTTNEHQLKKIGNAFHKEFNKFVSNASELDQRVKSGAMSVDRVLKILKMSGKEIDAGEMKKVLKQVPKEHQRTAKEIMLGQMIKTGDYALRSDYQQSMVPNLSQLFSLGALPKKYLNQFETFTRVFIPM